jgi:glucose/mannose transport system permease protein
LHVDLALCAVFRWLEPDARDTALVADALNNIAGSFTVEWNVQMAAAFLTALPTLLVYIVLGRYFLRGLLAGSLKG